MSRGCGLRGFYWVLADGAVQGRGQPAQALQAIGRLARGDGGEASCLRRAHLTRELAFSGYSFDPTLGRVVSLLCAARPGGEEVLVAELDGAALDARIAPLPWSQRRTYVVSHTDGAEGDLFFHWYRQWPTAEEVLANAEKYRGFVDRVLRGRGVQHYLSLDSKQVLGAYLTVERWGRSWTVVAERMEHRVLAGQQGWVRWLRLVVGLHLLLLTSLAVWWLAGRRRARAADQETPPAGAGEVDPGRGPRPLLVLGLSAAVLGTVFLFPVRMLEPDDVAFKMAMKVYARGQLSLRVPKRFKPMGWTANVQMRAKGAVLEKSPGHGLLLAGLHLLGLERLGNPLWALLCVALLLYAARALRLGRRMTVYLLVLFVSNPTLYILCHRAYMSDLSGAGLVTAFVLLLLVAEARERRALHLLAGLALGLSVGARISNGIFFALVPAYYLAEGLRGRWPGRSRALGWLQAPGLWLLLLGALLPLLGVMAYNAAITGSPLQSAYSFTLFRRGGMNFSEHILLNNLVDLPPMLLLGFPALLLLPLGLGPLHQQHPRVARASALLILLTLAMFGGYNWVRTDHAMFTTRFYLPALVGVSFIAAAALAAAPPRRALCLLCLLALLGALQAGDYYHRYVLSQQPFIRLGSIRMRSELPATLDYTGEEMER